MHSNQVELLDYMGSDKSHALAAWASTYFELGLDLPKDHKIRIDQIVDHILSNSKRMRSIEDLLKFLAENRHSSPLRFSSFMFGMKTEIATHIQKLKHAVLLEAENGESARYKELKEDNFYLPEDWKEYEVGKYWYAKLKHASIENNNLYHECLRDLIESGMPKSRAKESARFFKMYNSQIHTVNKLSFDGIIQFYYKRAAKDAQVEIGQIAKNMLSCIKEIEGNPFKYSLKAFNL